MHLYIWVQYPNEYVYLYMMHNYKCNAFICTCQSTISYLKVYCTLTCRNCILISIYWHVYCVCILIHNYIFNVFICTCQSASSYLKVYPDTNILTCVLCMRMSEMCILLVKFHIRWHFCLLSYDQHQDLPSLAKHEGHSSSVDQQLTTRSCTNIFWIC